MDNKQTILLFGIAIFLLFFFFSKKFRNFIITTTLLALIIWLIYYFYQQSLPQKPSYNPNSYPLNITTPCEVKETYGTTVLQWCGLITHYAKLNGLDPNFIAAVITVESGGNPEACDPAGQMIINNIEICGSSSGAIGLMQVMPSDGLAGAHPCGCFYDRPPSIKLLNPETNIAFGTHKLSSENAATDPFTALISYGGSADYAQLVLNVYYTHLNH